jgi:hypothetical protein
MLQVHAAAVGCLGGQLAVHRPRVVHTRVNTKGPIQPTHLRVQRLWRQAVHRPRVVHNVFVVVKPRRQALELKVKVAWQCRRGAAGTAGQRGVCAHGSAGGRQQGACEHSCCNTEAPVADIHARMQPAPLLAPWQPSGWVQRLMGTRSVQPPRSSPQTCSQPQGNRFGAGSVHGKPNATTLCLSRPRSVDLKPV